MKQASEAGQADAILVTDEMIDAGRRVLIESGILPFEGELGCEGGVAADIYRAMARLAESA